MLYSLIFFNTLYFQVKSVNNGENFKFLVIIREVMNENQRYVACKLLWPWLKMTSDRPQTDRQTTDTTNTNFPIFRIGCIKSILLIQIKLLSRLIQFSLKFTCSVSVMNISLLIVLQIHGGLEHQTGLSLPKPCFIYQHVRQGL